MIPRNFGRINANAMIATIPLVIATIEDSFAWSVALKNPAKIILIAAIVIIGIWLCVFIALCRKKNAQKNEDSNGASNSSEETLKKVKRADMSDSKDSDNGFADPDKNKDEK